MVRTQIQFTEEELAALRREAATRKVSVSAVVREAVDASIAAKGRGPSRDELIRRSLAAVGRFHSGTGDLSLRHDEYFAEAAED
jgi:hypothetical protein